MFDYRGHILSVAETISYTNTSPESLPNLLLIVEANRWSGVFTLQSLSWAHGVKIEDYVLEGNRLEIPLAVPLLPGENLELLIAYTLALPAIPSLAETSRPMPFGYTERQSNLVDWYPFLPPYLPGTGWLVHKPWSHGEHQVYVAADYSVEISLAEPVPGLVIAASAPAAKEDNIYTYFLEDGRNFVWSASPFYQVLTTTVSGTLIASYFFAYDGEAGAVALKNTANAMTLYRQMFGLYSHPSLSVVEADFLDGMEYSGLYFLSRSFYNLYDGTPRNYLTTIAAHETAHQWWYEQVGNDQALEPWLDEALCTYAERLFYERFYPESLNWWWDFRINAHQPNGWVNGSIYDYGGFRPYRDAVYLRGAIFLEELRRLIGDEAFFAFLRDYVARRAGQMATASDFFAILKEHTPADIGEVTAQYFKSP